MHNSSNFPIALSVSLVIHLSLIFSLSALGIIPNQAPLNEIEINYYPTKSKSALIEEKTPRDITQKNLDAIKPNEPIILSHGNKIPENGISAPTADMQELFLRAKDFSQKPSLPKTEFLVKNTIKLSPALDPGSSGKLSQAPAYLTYGNYVRERIRRCLYSRFSRIDDKGVVALRFSILTDGSLSDSLIIDEKSSSSSRLKQIALDGLKDASPFPRVPEELNGQDVTYTVFIHFIYQDGE